MNEEAAKFEVLSCGEMRKKYYTANESPPQLKLDGSKVPDSLRPLISLAEKWGVSDDILRADLVARAAPEELHALQNTVEEYRCVLNEWLAGPEADSPPFSAEYLAFTHMLMAADGY